MGSAVKTTIGIIIAIAILFVGLLYGARGYLAPVGGEESDIQKGMPDTHLIGVRAPYFDLPDRAGTHTTLTQLNDRPVVLVFVATWNEAASDQIKILDDYLAAHQGDELVRIVAIDTQEDRSVVSSFMKRGG